MATKQQEELAALAIAAGISAHAISDVISRGRLTKAETGLALKLFKKIVPATARVVGREAVGLARFGAGALPMAARGAVGLGRLAAFDEQLDERRDKEKEITSGVNRLAIELGELERDLKEIKTEESSLKKILNAFGFDESIETFDVAPSIEILEKEEILLSASLNAIAPQRYVEISVGYRESSNRKNELETERNAIVSFIEGIEKDKRQTFLDAFDIVDKEIREIFAKMNGGNAWLEHLDFFIYYIFFAC